MLSWIQSPPLMHKLIQEIGFYDPTEGLRAQYGGAESIHQQTLCVLDLSIYSLILPILG